MYDNYFGDNFDPIVSVKSESMNCQCYCEKLKLGFAM